MEKALVKNAADKTQVKDASRKERFSRDDQLSDIREVLASISGRRFVWRVLEKCQTFGSVWEPSAKIHYNSGQQDIGHFILAEITQADENLLFKMMTENKKGN